MKTNIFKVAKEKAEMFGVKNVLVATNTGASIRKAHEVFGQGYQFFAVGNPASAHESGLVGHNGISEETRKSLEAKGIKVALQDQNLFQKENLYFTGISLNEVIANASTTGKFSALRVIFNVWQQMFGDGPRVCLEIVFMAADNGLLPLDVDCIAIATPSSYCDLPDAALIVRPTKSQDMFSGELRIKDLILCPTINDVWFNNRPLP